MHEMLTLLPRLVANHLDSLRPHRRDTDLVQHPRFSITRLKIRFNSVGSGGRGDQGGNLVKHCVAFTSAAILCVMFQTTIEVSCSSQVTAVTPPLLHHRHPPV